MRERKVVPEILDGLPADDPAAQRSRRDLRMVDVLMGNSRWIAQALRARGEEMPVVELGAGEGCLAERLAEQGYEVTALDLVPRPGGLSKSVSWVQGDLFETFPKTEGAVVASLFLHHFEADQLRDLGELLKGASVLCFAEPLRSSVALAEGYALFPFVNSVTRYDMIVSIRAGFRKGELPRLLGLDESWRVEEETTLLGGYRMRAERR